MQDVIGRFMHEERRRSFTKKLLIIVSLTAENKDTTAFAACVSFRGFRALGV